MLAAIVVLLIINSKRTALQPGQGVTGSQPATGLPIDTSRRPSTGGQLPQKFYDSAIRVEDKQDSSQIKNSFDGYNNQDIKNFPDYVANGISLDYPPADNQGNLINLDLFSSSVGVKINPKVREIIGKNYYGLFYCINKNQQKEYGFVFDTGNNDLSQADKQHAEAVQDMKAWEPYLLKDIHNILFPNVNLDNKYLDQDLSFSDGKFRSAQFDFPTGKKSIVYTVKDAPTNRVYVSTSQECVQKGLDYLFDI